MNLVITGTGVVSPVGIGKDAFLASFIKGESSVRGSAGQDDSQAKTYCRAAKVADFDFGVLFNDRRFRRAAVVTQYALVAAAEALKEAGLDFTTYDGKRVGVVCGVTHGALGYSCDFHKGFSTEGPLGASPVLFSDSVLNAPTGALSLAFGIKGPSHTLVGGPDVGVQAIEYGAELVKDGKVDVCLVASSEALNERIIEAYLKFGLGADKGDDAPIFGEGAGAVIIERGKVAEGHGMEKAIVELASAVTMVAPEQELALRGVTAQALHEAGLSGSDITGVISGGGSDGLEAALIGDILPEAMRLLSVKGLVGESFCAGTLMNVVAAALLINEGTRVVEGLGACTGREGRQLAAAVEQDQSILFLTAGHRKEAGCLILKRS